ncbi:MAG: hypothetical protein ACP5D7_24400 [Limnospira sp.]
MLRAVWEDVTTSPVCPFPQHPKPHAIGLPQVIFNVHYYLTDRAEWGGESGVGSRESESVDTKSIFRISSLVFVLERANQRT